MTISTSANQASPPTPTIPTSANLPCLARPSPESAVVSNGALEPIAAQAEWNREYRDDTGESALTETLLQTRVFQLEQENKNYKVN